MPTSRPVSWVAPTVYGAVLVAGLMFAAAARDTRPSPAMTAGFVVLLGLLALLDLVEARHRPGPGATAGLLLARVALMAGVVALDGSGLARILFVLVPFTAYFAFGGRVAVALGTGGVLALVLWQVAAVPAWWRSTERVSDLLMFAVGMVLAVSMAAVAVDEQRARARLRETTSELAALSAAAERTRLARDIHDSLGHHLTATSIQLEKAAAFRDLDPAVAAQALAAAQGSTRRALQEVRRSVAALRADTTPFSLGTALREMARHVDGPTVDVEVTGDEHVVDVETLTTLLRTAQEGLTNALRHGSPSRVRLTARLAPHEARLIVADDGGGFHPGTRPDDGYGLIGMRERVHLLGGHVDVDGGLGSGATITVTIPAQATT